MGHIESNGQKKIINWERFSRSKYVRNCKFYPKSKEKFKRRDEWNMVSTTSLPRTTVVLKISIKLVELLKPGYIIKNNYSYINFIFVGNTKANAKLCRYYKIIASRKV